MSLNPLDLSNVVRAVPPEKVEHASEPHRPGDRMPERHLLQPLAR